MRALIVMAVIASCSAGSAFALIGAHQYIVNVTPAPISKPIILPLPVPAMPDSAIALDPEVLDTLPGENSAAVALFSAPVTAAPAKATPAGPRRSAAAKSSRQPSAPLPRPTWQARAEMAPAATSPLSQTWYTGVYR
ncbi:hypothetical protein [Paracoccus pacificus]|uniref:Uncharacterized protein n=1 Tax=Paracoccus pacificus TaxID=1463598 RepID=A0ABW4R861_9RHOB